MPQWAVGLEPMIRYLEERPDQQGGSRVVAGVVESDINGVAEMTLYRLCYDDGIICVRRRIAWGSRGLLAKGGEWEYWVSLGQDQCSAGSHVGSAVRRWDRMSEKGSQMRI